MNTISILIFLAVISSIYALTCSQCVVDATQVEQRLSNTTVQIQLGEYLNKTACQHFPDPERDVCGQIVLVFLPKIIDTVIQKNTREDICQELGYC